MIDRFRHKHIKPSFAILILIACIVARLAIAFSQRVFLMVEGSPIDDMLMIRAAMSILDGNWLGDYGPFAIAKNMGFALWLAFLHVFSLPFLIANAALWTLASGFATQALRPLFTGNVSRLCVFAFLAFQPVSFAPFNNRAYRDAIFPAFCLLLFAGVVGIALRMREQNLRGTLLCSLGAGIGLAGGWLLREDGIILLPYAACGLGLCLLFIWLGTGAKRRGWRAAFSLLPFGILSAGILAFSAVNFSYYGVFLVNDLTSGAFPSAYGNLVAVSQAVSGHVDRTPVTQDALEQIYEEVPSMALLKDALQPDQSAFKGFGHQETGEFGGSFYFGLRLAAYEAGMTPDASQAQAFWQQMATETQQAVAEGRLPSTRPAASVTPRWDNSLLGPTARETGLALAKVLLFQDCDPRPQESLDAPELVAPIAEFLHTEDQKGYVEGTDQPYYNPLQRAMFAFCDVLIWVYRILIWPLLLISLAQLGRILYFSVRDSVSKRVFSFSLLIILLSLGLLLSFLLRMGVSGFMEASSFGIGTYIMYLAGGVPALLLFCSLTPALQREV